VQDDRAVRRDGDLGNSRRWHEVLTQATKVAATETTVLLTGESGTGKEVVARFIHRGSPRRTGPFVALNSRRCPSSCSNPSCSVATAARSRVRRACIRARSSRQPVACCPR
jgi:DNA-binding NtrC family response regulator